MSEIIVEVDRVSRLEYPQVPSSLPHADFRSRRPVRYVFDDLQLWLLESQEHGSVSASVIYQRLKQERLLQRNIGYDDQLAIASQVPIDAVPAHLKGKWFPAYAGIIEGENSSKYLPVLVPLYFSWRILWVSLNNVFDNNTPTLLFPDG